MRNLIKLISLYNYSITFYLLLLISSYFLITENFILKTKYFNSSNYIAGSVFNAQSMVSEYFLLKKKNTLLEAENKKLKESLTNIRSINNFIENKQYNFIDAVEKVGGRTKAIFVIFNYGINSNFLEYKGKKIKIISLAKWEDVVNILISKKVFPEKKIKLIIDFLSSMGIKNLKSFL